MINDKGWKARNCGNWHQDTDKRSTHFTFDSETGERISKCKGRKISTKVMERPTELWAGEHGGHNGGGRHGITNRYASGLWYLDQMGSLARNAHTVFLRQDFVGANYGLLDKDSLAALPDYWTTLVWKKSMGRGVLEVAQRANFDAPSLNGGQRQKCKTLEESFRFGCGYTHRENCFQCDGCTVNMMDDQCIPRDGRGVMKSQYPISHPCCVQREVRPDVVDTLRTYAHCADDNGSGAVTVLLINLDAKAGVRVDAAMAGEATGSLSRVQDRVDYRLRAWPEEDDTSSHEIELNGEVLRVVEREDGELSLPPLQGQKMSSLHSIEVPALSYSFVTFPDAKSPACSRKVPTGQVPGVY